jgi:hypothetical protein
VTFVPVWRRWSESVERRGDMRQRRATMTASFDLKEEDVVVGPMMGLQAKYLLG